VSVRLRGREVHGVAVAARDPERVRERFAYNLKRNQHDGKHFGVRVGRDGGTDPGEFTRTADRLVMIRTVLDDAGEP
jgi:hypothetical protein